MTNRRRTIIVITTIMARGHAIMAILVKNQWNENESQWK
jgi:hypothetical protein